ncbi:MAG: tetratricopeptide repeat protein [Flavipsychrobacter sp.]|jgi:tetratricopeptide (TPR) repeat protein|nr:tetratricopeptide repeat protein [Flavipsychrobacter sp.]
MFDDDLNDEEWGPLDETLRKYEAVKKGESTSILDEEEFERVIEYYFQNSNEEQALLACEIAKTYYPFSASLLLLKAEILTQAQKYGQALKALDEMEQYDNNCLDAVLLRSDILLAQFKNDQAALWLEQRSADFGGKEKTEILLELSDVYDESEEFDAVFDTLQRVIKIDRRNEEALQKICFWAEFTQRLDESVTIHTQLTDDDPYNALAWFNLGAAYQGLKMYEKCIDAYEFCVAIDEKFEFAYRNMADAYMRLKWYEKALDVLEKHIEIAKPEDVIFEAMGYCWEKRKDYSRARQFYRQASQLSPQDDGIFYKIGETYAREKQWEKAVKSFSVALHLNKDNAAYCMAIGNCLMEMDVKSEALVCYLNAVRLKPGNKSTWVALIKGLYLAGYYDEAITQLGVAREHCGDKGDFYYYHAACLFELGKAKEAMLQLEKGMKTLPSKIKLFTELNPEFLRRSSVTDLIAKYKKK